MTSKYWKNVSCVQERFKRSCKCSGIISIIELKSGDSEAWKQFSELMEIFSIIFDNSSNGEISIVFILISSKLTWIPISLDDESPRVTVTSTRGDSSYNSGSWTLLIRKKINRAWRLPPWIVENPVGPLLNFYLRIQWFPQIWRICQVCLWRDLPYFVLFENPSFFYLIIISFAKKKFCLEPMKKFHGEDQKPLTKMSEESPVKD